MKYEKKGKETSSGQKERKKSGKREKNNKKEEEIYRFVRIKDELSGKPGFEGEYPYTRKKADLTVQAGRLTMRLK